MAVQIHLDYPTNTREGNTCSACHAGHRQVRDEGETAPRPERVVDFFINVDFEGFLMLCEQCILEAAGLLGWVSPAQRDAALNTAAELEREVARLRAERDEAKLLVRLIRDYDEPDEVTTASAFFQMSADGYASLQADADAAFGDREEAHASLVAAAEKMAEKPVRKTKARAAKATA